jgi:hypothetical protein
MDDGAIVVQHAMSETKWLSRTSSTRTASLRRTVEVAGGPRPCALSRRAGPKGDIRGLSRLGSRLELVSNALDVRPHERHGDVSYFRIQLLGGVAKVSRVGLVLIVLDEVLDTLVPRGCALARSRMIAS